MRAYLLILTALLAGCGSEPGDVDLRSAAVLVEAVDDVPERASGPAVAGAPEGAWTTDGKVEPSTWEGASFEIPGVVAEIYVKRGDRVQAGQLLGRIDITERLERLEAARDGYDTTRRFLPVARQRSKEKPPEWLVDEMEDRLAELRDDIERQDVDQRRIQEVAEAEDPQARAREIAVSLSRRHTSVPRRATVKRAAKERLNIALVDDFRSRMDKLQADIDRAELVSPISGVVVDVNVYVGDQWNTRDTQPSFELMDPASMVLRADLPLRRARLLVEGEPVWVEVEVDGAMRPMEGRVREIAEEPRYERKSDGEVVAEARSVYILLPRSGLGGVAIGARARVAFLQ